LFFGTDGLRHSPANDIDNYFSIYAIDTKPIPREFPSIIDHLRSSLLQIDDLILSNPQHNIDTTEVLKGFEKLQYKTFHDLKLFYLPGYTPTGIPFTLSSRPAFKLVYNQHNLNVINQEGLFVFNSDPTHPLEDYFTGGRGTSFQSTFILPKMKCWNIHKSLNEYIIGHLTEGRIIPIDGDFIYPQEEFIANNAFRQFKNFK
jgi:predicted oxidoreductase